MKPVQYSHRVIAATSLLAGMVVLWMGIMLAGNLLAAEKNEGDKQFQARSADERFSMLNVLWFKPEGGAKKYNEYIKAARPFVKKHGGKLEGAYLPEANIIGKLDADLVFFVEWPNEKSFTSFIQDPGYRAISHLRREALRDSLLIRCKKKTDSQD